MQGSAIRQGWQSIHPTHHSGKASARNDNQDDDGGQASTRTGRQSIRQTTTNATQTMMMMKAKASADAETLQREPATTTSRRPPQAEHPKRRLQRGSDAISAVVVRPKRSRLSPGKHNGGEGRGGKDDAFKKMNGARGRRRHWSARRPKAFTSTSNLLQSRGPNNAATTQESPPRGHQEQHKGRHM